MQPAGQPLRCLRRSTPSLAPLLRWCLQRPQMQQRLHSCHLLLDPRKVLVVVQPVLAQPLVAGMAGRSSIYRLHPHPPRPPPSRPAAGSARGRSGPALEAPAGGRASVHLQGAGGCMDALHIQYQYPHRCMRFRMCGWMHIGRAGAHTHTVACFQAHTCWNTVHKLATSALKCTPLLPCNSATLLMKLSTSDATTEGKRVCSGSVRFSHLGSIAMVVARLWHLLPQRRLAPTNPPSSYYLTGHLNLVWLRVTHFVCARGC